MQWLRNAWSTLSTPFRNYSTRINVDKIFHRFKNVNAIFTEEELQEFEQLTYLTSQEILKLYDQFCTYHPNMDEPKNPQLSRIMFLLLPEFAVNPFKERIVKVFAKGDDYISFEDYIDIMSAFNDRAPLSVKASYAFRIYDFDDDDMISKDDIKDIIYVLLGDKEFENYEIEELVDIIFKEADIDGDGYLNYPEFEHLIEKSPDFKNSFRIRI